MLKEFEFINHLKESYSLHKIGDDCAVLPKNSTHDMLITSDLLVEDIDFRLAWATPENIGHKALAVSLSDVAAMGGKPVYSMLSIGIPENVWKTNFVDEFYEGYFKLAKIFGVELIGGDVSKTPDKIVIDSTVFGEIEKGKAVFRSGAQVGDLIFVTGSLGGAAAGLRILEKGIDQAAAESWQKSLIARQVSPVPQVFSGIEIGKIATSMIDISDGLSSDLRHICKAGQVGAKIFAEKIPPDKSIFALTEISSEIFDYALNGGEDFELLFTASPQKNFPDFFRTVSCIGEVSASAEIIEFIDGDEVRVLLPEGFTHF